MVIEQPHVRAWCGAGGEGHSPNLRVIKRRNRFWCIVFLMRHEPEGVQTGARSGLPLPSVMYYITQLALSIKCGSEL